LHVLSKNVFSNYSTHKSAPWETGRNMSVNSVFLSFRKGEVSCCSGTIKLNLLLTEEFWKLPREIGTDECHVQTFSLRCIQRATPPI